VGTEPGAAGQVVVGQGAGCKLGTTMLHNPSSAGEHGKWGVAPAAQQQLLQAAASSQQPSCPKPPLLM